MPRVWRLAPPAFAENLDGEGARLTGGRWNRRGRPVVYTSSHLSLAVLEVYVHLPPALRDNLPEMEAVGITVPDEAGATIVSPEQFEALMQDLESFRACQAIGEDWLVRGADLVLQVPSAIVPQEANFILNIAHPAMRDVRIVSTRRFRFDRRLSSAR